MKTFIQYDNLVTEVQNVIGEGVIDGRILGNKIARDSQKIEKGYMPVWHLKFISYRENSKDSNKYEMGFNIELNPEIKIRNDKLTDLVMWNKIRPAKQEIERLERIVIRHTPNDDVKINYGTSNGYTLGGVMYVDGVKK